MRTIAAIATALGFLLMAPLCTEAENSWGTDMSDLWWNPSENGWGANISHQGDTIFLTMFVYGADGSVKWYVGPAMTSPGNDIFTFSGALYETRGPYFGGPYLASNVLVRQVGNATLSFPSVVQGTLSYSVDGVSVSKTIQRQTFRTNILASSYIGGVAFTDTGCITNGSISAPATFHVAQNGSSMSMTMLIGSLSCAFTGTYTQWGRMGDYSGTLACTNGSAGSFEVYEIEAGRSGFTAAYNANFGFGCTEKGRLAGVIQ